MQFITGHWQAIAGLAIALIDFGWAMNPNLKANGILHAVYKALGGKDPGSPSA